MAEKKVIIFTCDRCGLDHKRLRGKSLPAGWSNVAGNDLCPPCLKGLATYMAGLPTPGVKVDQAREKGMGRSIKVHGGILAPNVDPEVDHSLSSVI